MVQPADQQFVETLAKAILDATATKPAWLAYIPALSAMIAAVSASVSVWLTIKLAKEARGYQIKLAMEARGHQYLPIIVFYRRSAGIWTLKNVGQGTARSVVVRNFSDATRVRDQVELYPVAPGQEIRLDYLEGADKLIAGYVNIFGDDPHTSVCSNNANEFKPGELDVINSAFSKGHESDAEKWPMTRLN